MWISFKAHRANVYLQCKCLILLLLLLLLSLLPVLLFLYHYALICGYFGGWTLGPPRHSHKDVHKSPHPRSYHHRSPWGNSQFRWIEASNHKVQWFKGLPNYKKMLFLLFHLQKTLFYRIEIYKGLINKKKQIECTCILHMMKFRLFCLSWNWNGQCFCTIHSTFSLPC